MHSLEVHLDQGDQMARRTQSRISSLYSRFVGKNEAACAADASREVVERWLPKG